MQVSLSPCECAVGGYVCVCVCVCPNVDWEADSLTEGGASGPELV